MITSFSLSSLRFNYSLLFSIFRDIKLNYLFVVKLIVIILRFLVLNYNRYMYRRLGLRIMYGYVLIMAFFLVLYSWLIWVINNWQVIVRHFLPVGISGILKAFIPLLEIIGILIRPLTLGVRLATNIRCGHVVLLIFSYFAFNLRFFLVFSISVLLFGLYFIEFLVCLIQAYVFWRLLYIYITDIEV